MPKFTYTSLSSQDFEELARDALQAEWGVTLESFRNGRDQGIDLRYARPHQGTTVIQCKHFVGSGFDALLSHLKRKELPKIKLLNPDRYVVVTSVGLSPLNKKQIIKELHPFIRHESDIFAAGDLEGILSRNHDIVRAHFKLWLTSTEILDRVIHNAEKCHAEFVVERIRRNIPRFVQGRSFSRAMDIVDRERVIVISGVPGIGKTTLAEMLLYSFLEQGFEPVVIQSEIVEGKSLYRKDTKQMFYFDDFLGQFFLGDRSEYFGKNQDAALMDFIGMVRTSESARFVLTTREHLLQQALVSSERFYHGRLLDARYILELREYSIGDRARILYNHVYFSDLPAMYRDELLRDDFFLQIVKHPHFNPRLVEWLSSFARIRVTPPSKYQEFIQNLLAAPHDLWRYAFSNQLSESAQDVLLALYTLGESADIEDLDPAWDAVHKSRSQKYNRRKAQTGIRHALQELDGACLRYSKSHVGFINPSIREFVASSIVEERTTAEDLLQSAIRFGQLVNLYKLAQSSPNTMLQKCISSDTGRFAKLLDELLETPETRWRKTNWGQRGYQIDMYLERRIEFILEIASLEKSEDLLQVASSGCSKLGTKIQTETRFQLTTRLLGVIKAHEWFLSRGGRTSYRTILDQLLAHLHRADSVDWLTVFRYIPTALDWTDSDQEKADAAWADYLENGLADEIGSFDSIDEYENLADSLRSLSRMGHDLTEWIDDVEETIKSWDHDGISLEEGDEPIPSGSIETTERHITDAEIRQMFLTVSDPLRGND